MNIEKLTEVSLPKPDDFLKVKETLTRIGISSKRENILYQSCHILHKQGRYFIVHFKQMFALDGKRSDFSDEDRARLNTITNLLSEWGLVNILRPDETKEPLMPLNQIKIIHFKDKENWNLIAKYNIGKRKF